jgi:hypothetical protein
MATEKHGKNPEHALLISVHSVCFRGNCAGLGLA